MHTRDGRWQRSARVATMEVRGGGTTQDIASGAVLIVSAGRREGNYLTQSGDPPQQAARRVVLFRLGFYGGRSGGLVAVTVGSETVPMDARVVARRSLKTRVTVLTLLIFAASNWLLAFYAMRTLRAELQRFVSEQQMATTAAIADEINRALASRLTALGQAAAAIDGDAPDRSTASAAAPLVWRPVLEGLFNGGVIAYRRDGRVGATLASSATAARGRVGTSDAVAAALADGKPTIGTPRISGNAEFPEFVMAVPIRDAGGAVIGAVAGTTDLNTPNFVQSMSQRGFDMAGGHVLIASRDRTVLTASDTNRGTATLPGPGVIPWIDRALQGGEGSAVYVNQDGVELLASARIVSTSGWLVVSSLPTEQALAPVSALQWRILMAAAVLTLLAGLLISWALRRELSPLVATARALAALSDTPERVQPLPIVRDDEIGQLLGGFNRLLDRLRQRNDALRESERSLREAQAVARIGSYVLDVPRDAWTSSAMLDTIFGIGAEYERSIAGWGQTVHPTEREQMVAYVGSIFAAHGHFDREYRIVRLNDGVERWVLGLGKVEYAADGSPVRMVGTIQDITERRQVEMALAQSEVRFRAIFDGAPDPMIIADPVTRKILDANSAACRLLGRERAEILTLHQYDLHPSQGVADSRETFNRHVEESQQLGFTHPTETSVLRRDGTEVPVEIVAQLVDLQEQRVLLGIFRDISERRRAEERVRQTDARARTIFEQAGDGVVSLSAVDLSILSANESFARMHGYSVAEVLTMSMRDFDVPEAVQQASGRVTRLTAGEVLKFEVEHYHKDGHTFPVEVTANLVDFDGRRLILAFNRDVTERNRALQATAALEAQLQQAQKMESVGRLAGGVAHDFNNMLGVILGTTEIALEQVEPGEPLHADLLEIQKAANRSADLTRQLLAFARKQTVVPEVLDLNETVPGLLSMLQRLIGEDIQLVWQPAASLWPVAVDPSQLANVLTNLCVNARDAIADVGTISMGTGNCVVDAAFCPTHPDAVPGEYVRLTVRDTGSGMDAATLAQIFEPFFTTKAVGEGTGLGLASVYGSVRQNNGFVTASSEPGCGTEFSIYLPRLERDAHAESEPSEESQAARGRETILLVEDEPAILRLVTRALRALGYTVIPASGPDEAMLLAAQHEGEIQLLLTDVIMPGMNGRDLARSLATLRPALRQLFMSGHSADVIARRGMLEHGVSFIEKPFAAAALAAKVRQALDSEREPGPNAS